LPMKRFLILLAATIVTMAAVTGSIAYFTDEVVASGNVIVAGNLDVQQREYERVKVDGTNAELRRFTQQQALYPCVIRDTDAAQQIVVDGKTVSLPTGYNNYIDKIVNVSNNGNLQACVRTVIAVPSRNAGMDWIHLNRNTDGWTWTTSPVENVTIDGETYNLYTATYNTPLLPGDTTSPSLLGYYLDPNVSNNGSRLVYRNDTGEYPLGDTGVLRILVATQAAQGNPEIFANAETALEETFRAITASNHPWVDAKLAKNQAELNTLLTGARYGDVIALQDGEYTLPDTLAEGVRLVGWGAQVRVKGGHVSARNVELDNLTFTGKLQFNGYGSFLNVRFAGGLETAVTPEASNVVYKLQLFNCRADSLSVVSGGERVTLDNCTRLDGKTPLTLP